MASKDNPVNTTTMTSTRMFLVMLWGATAAAAEQSWRLSRPRSGQRHCSAWLRHASLYTADE